MGYAQCTGVQKQEQKQTDVKCMCPECLYKRAYDRYSKTLARDERRTIALLSRIPEQIRNSDKAVGEFGAIWFVANLDVLGIPKDLPSGTIFVLMCAFGDALIDASKKLREGKDTPG